MVEALIVLALLAVLSAVAAPRVSAWRDRIYLDAARRSFRASQSLARQVASQYGRASHFWIDAPGDRWWVTVDTGYDLWPARQEDTVRTVVDLGSSFGGVDLSTGAYLLCYDPRGLGTPAGDCPLPNATIVLSRGRLSDTLALSRLGRLRER